MKYHKWFRPASIRLMFILVVLGLTLSPGASASYSADLVKQVTANPDITVTLSQTTGYADIGVDSAIPDQPQSCTDCSSG